MGYKFKSLNCYSCGAGLIKKIDSDTCQCSYCKNTNLILKDGSTKIVDLIEEEQKQKTEKKLPIWIYLLIPLICLVPMLLIFYKKDKDRKEKRVFEKGGKIEYV